MSQNDETIQLVIDAKNLSEDELKQVSSDLDKVAEKSNKAEKELKDLEIKKSQIATFTAMKKSVDESSAAYRKQIIAHEDLVASTKKLKNATNEEREAVIKSKQALDDQKKTLNSQKVAYKNLAKEVSEFGLHTRNAEVVQEKLNAETIKAEKNLKEQRAALERLTAKKEKAIVVDKKATKELEAQEQAVKEVTKEKKKQAAETDKQIAKNKREREELDRVEKALEEYTIELKQLNAAKKKGVTSTGDYIRAEEALRKRLKLTATQASATNRAIAADEAGIAKKVKSTDALTTVTRRLAQAYTVLLAAQKATQAVGSSVKGYSELEAAITKVEKTTGIARDQVVGMSEELREMAEQVTPTATNELLRYAEVAGQMGVSSSEDIMKIVSAADALAVSTDLAGEEAALLSARILGMTGEGVSEIHEFASALVEMGNSAKASESEILHMTKEIVTGTTALNFSSAAAVGFGTALKEMGQPAERSRSAMQDLSNTILDLANEGGDGLEHLANITGLTAQAIEDGLGSEPEQVIIRFIQGLQNAKEAGITLKTSLAAVGITSKETNAVVGSLAGNTERLSELVAQASKAYDDGTAHISEASKAYADQESSIGRLTNAFTSLKAKIGEAYAPDVADAVESFTSAMNDNESAIITMMELLPELVYGLEDVVSTVDDLFAALGGLSGVWAGLSNAFKKTLNEITLSVRTLGLGINEIKIYFAELAGASEESLKEMRAASAKIAAGMSEDLDDIADAVNRFEGTSSVAYEKFIDATNNSADAISQLSEEQQAEIQQLLDYSEVLGESSRYSAENESAYRKLTAAITRATNARKIEAAQLDKLAEQQEKSAKADAKKSEAIRKLSSDLTYFNKALKESKKHFDAGIISEEHYLKVSESLQVNMKTRTDLMLELTGANKLNNEVVTESNNLAESWIQVGGETITIAEALAESTKTHSEAVKTQADSLTLANGEVLKGAELQQHLATTMQNTMVSTEFFTGGIDNTSDAVRALNLTELELIDTITDLKSKVEDANTPTRERQELLNKLTQAESDLADAQRDRALLESLEGKRAIELRNIHNDTVRQLGDLKTQYRQGAITAGEYAEKSEVISQKLATLDGVMQGVIPTTKELAAAQKQAAAAQDEIVESGTRLANAMRNQGTSTSAATWLLDAYNKAVARMGETHDYSAKSVDEMATRVAELEDELSGLNEATMPSSLVGLTHFQEKLKGMIRVGIENEKTTIRQTQNYNKLIAKVESGSLSMDQLARSASSADYYFNKLSDNQLDSLRSAISAAQAEFASLTGTIVDTLDSLEDRLDTLTGNTQSILARQYAKEQQELKDLLAEAKATGDSDLVNKVKQAQSTSKQVNKIEKAELVQETKASTGTSESSYSSSSTTTNHNVTITLPNGSSSTVSVASASDANTLISALASMGDVNINGVT